jgi:hypothetical protein
MEETIRRDKTTFRILARSLTGSILPSLFGKTRGRLVLESLNCPNSLNFQVRSDRPVTSGPISEKRDVHFRNFGISNSKMSNIRSEVFSLASY